MQEIFTLFQRFIPSFLKRNPGAGEEDGSFPP
jgi:hypothetical protein